MVSKTPTAEIKLDKNIRYSGKYRFISFEIQNFRTEEEVSDDPIMRNWWTLYIYLAIEQIPKEYKPESFWIRAKGHELKSDMKHKKPRLMYDDYKHRIISGIDFHGGCTYYEKRGEKHERQIKIGCDYQHLHDDRYRWVDDPKYLIEDVKRCIDSVWELMPTLKVHCSTVGGWWSLGEGDITQHGEFISKLGQKWRKKQGYDPMPLQSPLP